MKITKKELKQYITECVKEVVRERRIFETISNNYSTDDLIDKTEKYIKPLIAEFKDDVPEKVIKRNQNKNYEIEGNKLYVYELEKIDKSAFRGCTELTSITIPDSVTSIGDFAFYGCPELTSITIPDSVASIGQFAFAFCLGLTEITIPDSVTSISSYAFFKCTELTSITIGNSVTLIDACAFQGCTKLTSISLPDSVASIGNGIFAFCSRLTSVTYKGRTYTSNSAIESALKSNGVTIRTNIFINTKLS